jgi:aspartate aminotransferase
MTAIDKFISLSANSIEASITMEITAIAKKLQTEGKPVISMSAGEPDFDTPDFIKEAGIKSIRDGKTKYTDASGIAELKLAVCAKLKRDQNLTYTSNQIIISSGAKHSIFNALMAIINPGDEIIVPAPYWVSYPAQVTMLGGVPIYIEATQETNFKITAQMLKAAITSKTKCVLLNSPSNPTGMIYTREELQALADVIVQNDILVLSDEIYEPLVYDGEFVSIAELGDEIKKRTILVNGVSKAYSMTGWRIGYTAAESSIISAMSRLQSHATSNPNNAAQYASVEALNGPQDVLVTMRNAFHARRDVIVKRLNAIPGVSCLNPQGAFYAFANTQGLHGKKSQSGVISNSLDVCKFLLQEKLVACVPGEGFGAPGFVRFSYATSMENINEALDRFEDWVKQLS